MSEIDGKREPTTLRGSGVVGTIGPSPQPGGLTYVVGRINNSPCKFLIDTGSSYTLVHSKLCNETLPSDNTCTLVTISGSTLTVHGPKLVALHLGSLTLQHSVRYCDITEDAILGMDFLLTHNTSLDLTRMTLKVEDQFFPLEPHNSVGAGSQPPPLARVVEPRDTPSLLKDLFDKSVKAGSLNSEQADRLRLLLSEFSDVFSKGESDLGNSNIVEHKIDVGDNRPIKQRPRRIPPFKVAEVRELVRKMEAQGIIEPSHSPWASPIVLVPKKDGSTRFCVDYRRLNDITVKDSFPLPIIDDILSRVSNARWFSTLDFQSGYWQVRMDEADREKTAFVTPDGLWQFLVMPFGLTNAPATFQRLMSRVLNRPMRDGYADVFLDDVLIHAHNFEEHLNRLSSVFTLFRKSNLKLNPKKCVLFTKQVSYLGYVLSDRGIQTDPAKIKVVQEWQIPSDKRQVKSFLGLCSFYRNFIRNFAHIAKPLYVLSEAKDFVWTETCAASFQELKTALTSSPILGHVSREGAFILDTDASDRAIGAVLSQVQSDKEVVLGYYSKCLSRAERNYCVTRRELLSVVKAIRHFAPMGLGMGSLIVRTDHGSLKWLLSFKQPDGQLARWMEDIAPYKPEIQYRPGSQHGNADALSRRPCAESGCNYCEKRESNDALGKALAVAAIPSAPWDDASLKAKQSDDANLNLVLGWLRTGERPSQEVAKNFNSSLQGYWAIFPSLELVSGVLYRRWEHPSGKTTVLQVVVPTSLQKDAIQACHEGTGGHFGENKTFSFIRRRFFWMGCRRSVKNFCAACAVCSKRDGTGIRIHAELQPSHPGAPFNRVGLDILGPFPRSTLNNRYVLVLMDYFTKWPEAIPVPNQTAETVAEALVANVFSRFGTPGEIHTDQGRNFESRLFKEVLSRLGVKRTRSTPLHPQSCGLVERFNRTLTDGIAKLVSDHQKDWDLQIPLFLLAYRAAEHVSTGYSPAMLNLGRELTLPVDLQLGRRPDDQAITEYARCLQERLQYCHQAAKEALEKRAVEMKARYDAKSRIPTFKEGDKVWLHNPRRKRGLCPKLQNDWEGPYTVVKKISDLVVRIQSGKKQRVVHVDRLAPYRTYGEEKG